MPPDGRTDWTDARLDDLYEEVKRMTTIVDRVPVLESVLQTVANDAATCRKSVHGLRSDMTSQFVALRNDTQQAAALQAAERKSDRKWLVGAILSAAGLVIAAVGVLAGHIG